MEIINETNTFDHLVGKTVEKVYINTLHWGLCFKLSNGEVIQYQANNDDAGDVYSEVWFASSSGVLNLINASISNIIDQGVSSPTPERYPSEQAQSYDLVSDSGTCSLQLRASYSGGSIDCYRLSSDGRLPDKLGEVSEDF
jgi:hypothetical protein